MLKVAICEDILSDRESLERLLDKTGLFTTAEYSYYDNGKELITSFDNGSRYDFLFLDVDMPFVNGIETGKYINSIDSEALIIFVTSYPQYAMDAFDCNAFHYVLKNADYERFYSIVFKAMEKYKIHHRTYCIDTKDGVISIPITNIFYIEYCRKHLIFHTSDEIYIVRGTIGEAVSRLSELGFYQCHQGYIVNFDKVRKIQNYDIVLENNSKVMMSVRKRPEVLRAYNDYIGRYMV